MRPLIGPNLRKRLQPLQPMTELPSFDGFPREGLDFLAELEANNTRDFFQTHREVYERAVVGA